MFLDNLPKRMSRLTLRVSEGRAGEGLAVGLKALKGSHG